MKKKLSNSFWCVLGLLVGVMFTYFGIIEGDSFRGILGPIISLVNIWLLYMIWKDNDDSWLH